jgi:hypothetical protein
MVGLKTDPLLRNLRGDGRFQALLSRMNLNGEGHAADIQM